MVTVYNKHWFITTEGLVFDFRVMADGVPIKQDGDDGWTHFDIAQIPAQVYLCWQLVYLGMGASCLWCCVHESPSNAAEPDTSWSQLPELSAGNACAVLVQACFYAGRLALRLLVAWLWHACKPQQTDPGVDKDDTAVNHLSIRKQREIQKPARVTVNAYAPYRIPIVNVCNGLCRRNRKNGCMHSACLVGFKMLS